MPKFRKKPVVIEATQWHVGEPLVPRQRPKQGGKPKETTMDVCCDCGNEYDADDLDDCDKCGYTMCDACWFVWSDECPACDGGLREEIPDE